MHKDHWRNPRKTIATKFENNDYGYLYHGVTIAMEILKYDNRPMRDYAKLRILDYGCGTGRIARILALTGAEVGGYDPTPECIVEAANEAKKTQQTKPHKLSLTDDINQVVGPFHIITCVNVLEHLVNDTFTTAINNITQLLADGGNCYLWLHKVKNIQFITESNITIPNCAAIFVVKGTKLNGKVTYEPCST